ncbi:hypothetical protein SYK_02800 [Pseudodesulfovibrio nedwellii]|uniref:Terminase small subunit n=1 Tax=Pseudodesulfovibrio nedwellii TaxID=2973072 RepID=A0ABN6S2J8_9BACT|nr:terminase small subunit [Pseudodesulfovibrio nedwellii]BDQ35920.1 hypothetical protein SYK_02800 [Pseudodesulfovibrio nedwellii]
MAKKKATKLSEKQKKFVREYLVDLNATQAAVRAGYSEKTARKQGSRLLTNVDIQKAIQSGVVKREKRTEIDQDYVINTIVETVERCKQAKPVIGRNGQHLKVENSDGEMAPAYTFEPNAILKGTKQLGQHLGMFTERIDHNHSGSVELKHAYSHMLAEIDGKTADLMKGNEAEDE